MKRRFLNKMSEMWHAKSVHTCSCFLPKESPLAAHIHSSYLKHHLNPKLEQREQQRKEKEKQAELEAKKLKQEQALLAAKMREQALKEKAMKDVNSEISRNRNMTESSIHSPRTARTHRDVTKGETLTTARQKVNYSKLHLSGSDKKNQQLKEDVKVTNEVKLKKYMDSVRDMYNQQMAKMKSKQTSMRFYDHLRANKKASYWLINRFRKIQLH